MADTSSASLPADGLQGRARPPSIDIGPKTASISADVGDGDTQAAAGAAHILAARSSGHAVSSPLSHAKVSPNTHGGLRTPVASPGGPAQVKVNSMTSEWTTQTDDTPGRLAYACYYVVLFFAYFLGANSFDHNQDGHFDPEDVQAYLQDKGLLKKNFKKVKKSRDGESSWGTAMVRVLFPGTPQSNQAAGRQESPTVRTVQNISGDYMDFSSQALSIMQENNISASGEYVVTITVGQKKYAGCLSIKGKLTFHIQGKAATGRVLDNGDIIFGESVLWRRQATSAGGRDSDTAGVDPPTRTSNLRDLLGDAVDSLREAAETVNLSAAIDNMMMSEVQAVPEKGLRHSEESRIFEKIVEQQNLPKFVIFETLAIFLIWLVGAIVAWYQGRAASPWDALAGLATFWPESILALTGNSCEDYKPQVHRWLLYQFSHKGLAHVAMNAIMIVVLGIPLEGSGGTKRMFLLFNLGVIGGAMCYMVGDGHRMVVGASGGVYALLAMHFSNLILNWRQRKFRKPTLALLLILVVADVATVFLTQGWRTISLTAHIGGFFTGLLAGIAFGRNYDVRRWNIALQVLSFILLLAFWASCLTWVFLQEDLGPRNISDVMNDTPTWCWVRQVMDGNFGDPYACVKCGTAECIDYWTTYCSAHDSCQGLLPVFAESCEAHGAEWANTLQGPSN